MNAVVGTRKLHAILCTNLLACTCLYLISPLLAIYFVEPVSHGGLGWSKADAFSVFGTFLSVLYVTPLLGGIIRDRWLGMRVADPGGYIAMIVGAGLLSIVQDSVQIMAALILFGMGSGLVKVRLAAIIGELPKELRTKGYDLYYNTSCIGFVTGALVGPCLLLRFSMSGLALFSCVGLFVALACHLLFVTSQKDCLSQTTPVVDVVALPQVGIRFFVSMSVSGLIFFACFNQLLTSIPIYIHQCLSRSVWDFAIPAPWFGVFGSLFVTALSPIFRKWWSLSTISHERLCALKCSLGCVVAAVAFAILSFFTHLGLNTSLPALNSVGLMMTVHVLCYIADFHVRPTLLSLATHSTSFKHHTLATGFVFTCIGLGAKSAGLIASIVDSIGFDGVFMLCLVGCLILAIGFFLLHRYLDRREIRLLRAAEPT